MLRPSPVALSSIVLVVIGATYACGGSGGSNFGDGNSNTNASSSGSSGFDPTKDDGGGSSSGTSGGPSCATGEAAANREPVYLDIILDGSRSMDGHASTVAGCDPRHNPPASGTCFIKDARETDPLAPNRSMKVCHDENDTMDPDCPNFKGLTGKKWLAARSSLIAFFEGAKAKADPRFGVGMYLFGSSVTKVANQWDVQPAFVDQAQVDKLKARVSPNVFPTTGGTPLRGSMLGQTPLLKAFTPVAPLEPNGKRVLVIVTDGAASDCDDGDANDCHDIVDMAKTLRDGTPSVTTFVIGVGEPKASDNSVYNETFLSQLANAGGAAPEGCVVNWNGQLANPGVPCHFQVTPGQKSAAEIQQELSAAMNSIAAKVQSCDLTLVKTSPIDPAKVNVVYANGAGQESQIAKDPANGWSYDNEADPTKVILNGTSCQSLKDDVNANVKIVVGCPTGTSVR